MMRISEQALTRLGRQHADVCSVTSSFRLFGISSLHESFSTYPDTSKASKDRLPAPGAPLKKAVAHDSLLPSPYQARVDQEASQGHATRNGPPWREAESISRLKKALKTYKMDLRQGRNGPVGSKPSTDALPFLEDTITHLVGREQSVLLRQSSGVNSQSRVPPSRVRAAAMKQALARDSGVDVFLQSDFAADISDGSQSSNHDSDISMVRSSSIDSVRSSLIYQANRIISIIAMIEHLVPLTNEQKVAISTAVARMTDQDISNSSTWKMINLLTNRCRLSGEEVAPILSKYPSLLTDSMAQSNSIESIVDCLQLLELSMTAISQVISNYPKILFADVDKHMLPILAYLSDLGLDDADMAEIVYNHPSIFKPGNTNKLQSGVAFWTGKGLSRGAIVRLIKMDPTILEANKWVMQMKVDWLTEHTGLPIEKFASEPRSLSANLGSKVAPRIAFVNHIGVDFLDHSEDVLADLLNKIMSPDVQEYFTSFDISQSTFESFVDVWYSNEFIPWLEKKSRMSEILLKEENELFELNLDKDQQEDMDNFAASKEFAWEQQLEREREWHMAWHAWKREQQSLALAERSSRRQERRNHGVGTELYSDTARSERPSVTMVEEQNSGNYSDKRPAVPSREEKMLNSEQVQNLWRSHGHTNSNGRTIYFLSRKWTCDSTIDEALLQAVRDTENPSLGPKHDLDFETFRNLSIERVQSCAVNLLLLLRASEYGVLEPSVFNAWAARSGVNLAELTAAKALISLHDAANVRCEPSWKYHAVPPKVWRLPDAPFHAPNLLPLRDTRSSRNVSDLADLIYKSLKENPESPLTRTEISSIYDNKPEFQSKRMRFAIGILLEQGLVIQRRRRGIASGPMELVLTETLFKIENV
jgi:hypothetical protein